MNEIARPCGRVFPSAGFLLRIDLSARPAGLGRDLQRSPQGVGLCQAVADNIPLLLIGLSTRLHDSPSAPA